VVWLCVEGCGGAWRGGVVHGGVFGVGVRCGVWGDVWGCGVVWRVTLKLFVIIPLP
jgi:hypothetical protein